MAYSKQAVISTGGLAYMPITISYMFRDEIRVYFDDVAAVDGTWAWVGAHDAAITFSPAIAAGVTVRVQRFTRLGAMDHDFSDGAQFLAQNLDDNYNQLLHSLQEVAESGLSGLPAEGGIAGVSSFNGRAGSILLNSADVIGALGYTPAGGSLNVKTFNGRDGDVLLTVGDVTALGFVVGGGGGGGSPTTVLNIATLRTSPSVGGTTIETRGYYTNGDGGAAKYYLDSADTTSADNGGEVIVSTDGGRWKLAKGPVYSSKQFGARGDSSYSVAGSDDTVALQRFLNYVQKTGSKGYIPSGRYRCTNQLNITDTCTIFGDGWKDVRDMVPSISPTARDWTLSTVVGTILYADFFTGTAAAQLYVTGNSVTISDMEFETNQPPPATAGWTPNAVPLAISAFRANYYEQGGNSLTVDNVMLRNHNNGIKMFGVSRGYLNNLYGQVFGSAVDVTHNGDVFRANNLHFNWSFFSGKGDPLGAQTGTNDYMDAHSQILLMGRVDNPIVSNLFTFGGQIGIHCYVDQITPDGGSTFRLQGSNIGLDNIAIGVRLDDACSVNFSNLYVYNRSNVAQSRGIHGTAVLGGGYTPQRLNLVNCDFQGSMAEAIRLEVPGVCNMSNVQVTDYNNSGGAYPAVAAYSGVTINYVNLSNTTPSATPLTQAFGTGVINGGGGGGGSGVTSFNSRTGVVNLTSTDVTDAFTATPRLFSQAGTFRATGETPPATGAGVELNFSTSLNSGFLNAYDHDTSLYKDLAIGGRNIAFKTAAAGNSAGIDSAGILHLYYPPSAADNSDKAVTSAWVRTFYTGAAKLTSFQGRTTAAAVLTSGDVTGVLGGTPMLDSSPSSSGLYSSAGTIRVTGNTPPGSGTGLQMSYNAGGYVISYNSSTAQYTDLSLGGNAIIFTNNSGPVAQFTSASEMLLGTLTDNGAYRLQVNGQIWATSATIATSDRRLKENISDLGDATRIVKGLRAVTYDFKEHATLDLPKGKQIGVIAQEVQEALAGAAYSESVVSTAGPYLGVAEVKLVPLLLKALQEALARIEALERK